MVEEYLTIDDIARAVGIHRSNIVRKSGINDFRLMTNVQGVGRPVVLFRREVLRLWGMNEPTAMPIRKVREDRGRPRKGISAEMDQSFKDLVYSEYMSCGIDDIRAACRRAAKDSWSAQWADVFSDHHKMADYYYKDRICRNDAHYTGFAFTERWREQWRRQWKRSDTALITLPTMRYNYLELGEDLGLIGRGYGAGTIFWLDDHTGDSFLKDEERVGYKGSLPKGLFMIDGWTGMMLDYEPGEVTSTMTALMVIRGALRFGLPFVVGMENSRAMKAVRVEKIIEALYPAEIAHKYTDEKHNYWLRALFGQADKPVIRNIPNIPRFPFKARLESIFKNVKYHDAVYFPRTYQGGGKSPVQLHLNTTPVAPGRHYTPELYQKSLIAYLKSDYLETPRPGMFPGFFNKTGQEPTIASVWDWYGGNENAGTKQLPSQERIAEVLYWLADEEDSKLLRRTFVRAHAGRCNCTIDGIPCWFVDASLNGMSGEKIAVVTIPDSISAGLGRQVDWNRNCNYAALFHIRNGRPHFLNIAKNIYTTNVDEIETNRAIVHSVRKAWRDDLDNARGNRGSKTKEIVELRERTVGAYSPAQGAPEPCCDGHAEEETTDEGGLPSGNRTRAMLQQPPAPKSSPESGIQNDLDRLLRI